MKTRQLDIRLKIVESREPKLFEQLVGLQGQHRPELVRRLATRGIEWDKMLISASSAPHASTISKVDTSSKNTTDTHDLVAAIMDASSGSMFEDSGKE